MLADRLHQRGRCVYACVRPRNKKTIIYNSSALYLMSKSVSQSVSRTVYHLVSQSASWLVN